MAQGQFTLADIQPSQPPIGQFTRDDITGLPSVPHPQVNMEEQPLTPVEKIGVQAADTASHVGDAVAKGVSTLAKPVVEASAPNVAMQLYRHYKGLPNTLDKIPESAVSTFLMAGGIPEGEAAEPVATAKPVTPSFPGAPLPEKPPQELLQARTVGQGAQVTKDPAAGLSTIPAKPEVPATYPGASLPAKPPAEVLQAQPLAEGGKPGTSQSDALAKIPNRTISELPAAAVGQAIQELGAKASIPDVTERANNIAKLSELLNQGLGGKGLEPNVPIKNQGAVMTPGATEVKSNIRSSRGFGGGGTSELPEPQQRNPAPSGESTAVGDFRYDPDAQEMHITSKGTNARTYVYGEVTPEQAQMFHAAESKGMAWKAIRDNNPYVAKIIDGKRMSVKPAAPDNSQ